MTHRVDTPNRHNPDRSRTPGRGWSTDRAIRFAAVAAVLAVATVAAVVSYRHAYEVVSAHGETGLTARLVPLTIDGLIASAGMVLLQAARHRLPVPPLAHIALWLGILATVAANVAHGLPYGAVGALVAAWPAVALIVAYETLMRLLRASRAVVLEAEQANQPVPVSCQWPHAVPTSVEEAVRHAYEAGLDGWVEELSQRELAARFETTRPRVRRWVEEVDRERSAARGQEESPNGRVDHPEPAGVEPGLDGQGPARGGP